MKFYLFISPKILIIKMLSRINPVLNKLIKERLIHNPILCLNGNWNNINKKCICYPGYRLQSPNKCKLIKFNKITHLRGMLSNETISYLSRKELSDIFIIILLIIIIICFIFIIRYLYKKYKEMKEKEEEIEDNELSDKAKFEFEANYLNSKTFSFIPISSPIKLKGTKTEKNDSNSDEKKNNNNSNDELKIEKPEKPEKIKIDYINSFCITCDNEKIDF